MSDSWYEVGRKFHLYRDWGKLRCEVMENNDSNMELWCTTYQEPYLPTFTEGDVRMLLEEAFPEAFGEGIDAEWVYVNHEIIGSHRKGYKTMVLVARPAAGGHIKVGLPIALSGGAL